VAKKKKGKRPPPKPIITAPKTSSSWVWWAVIGGVVALGLVAIVVARSSKPAPAPPPDGVQTFEETARDHTDQKVAYERRPPTGGPHAGIWLNCGIYDQPVPDENAVHSLEHGAVWVTYKPDLPGDQVQKLRGMARDHYNGAQRYVVLSPYPSLTDTVSVQAWAHQLRTQDVNDPRIGQFISHFQARRGVTPEPGGACTGGVGNPIG
jgi:hypothetical protein